MEFLRKFEIVETILCDQNKKEDKRQIPANNIKIHTKRERLRKKNGYQFAIEI